MNLTGWCGAWIGNVVELVFGAKKFRLCPPLVETPCPVETVIMAEVFGTTFCQVSSENKDCQAGEHQGVETAKVPIAKEPQQPKQQEEGPEWIFEAGFGRYIAMSAEELKRGLVLAQEQGGQTMAAVHVVPGLQAVKGQRGHCVS